MILPLRSSSAVVDELMRLSEPISSSPSMSMVRLKGRPPCSFQARMAWTWPRPGLCRRRRRGRRGRRGWWAGRGAYSIGRAARGVGRRSGRRRGRGAWAGDGGSGEDDGVAGGFGDFGIEADRRSWSMAHSAAARMSAACSACAEMLGMVSHGCKSPSQRGSFCLMWARTGSSMGGLRSGDGTILHGMRKIGGSQWGGSPWAYWPWDLR